VEQNKASPVFLRKMQSGTRSAVQEGLRTGSIFSDVAV
jgi:hypothetical protein